MASDGIVVRAGSFDSPVYRDGFQIHRQRNTATTAVDFTGFYPASSIDSALAVARNFAAGASVGNGYLEMGSADAVELVIGGAAAAGTVDFIVEGICPCFNTSAPNVAANYFASAIVTGTCTLGSITAGATGALLLDINSADVLAGGYSLTHGAPAGFDPAYVIDPGSIAMLRVMACGAPILRIRTDINTASNSWVMARRLNNFLGGAQRSQPR